MRDELDHRSVAARRSRLWSVVWLAIFVAIVAMFAAYLWHSITNAT